MRGYVAKRRNRHHAVIHEGIDPTGRERRRWHPAGPDRDEAQHLAHRRAAQAGADDHRRPGPTLGTHLTKTWLPMKQPTLRPSTWHSYRRNIALHVLPELGRTPLRHLRHEHLERLYAELLPSGRCRGDRGLSKVARSGLPRIRFHDLRHTHATLLLKAGVPIKVVSERLGHATPNFTMATYQHVLPGMRAEAVQTFAAILSPSNRFPRWNARHHAKRPWSEQRSDPGR